MKRLIPIASLISLLLIWEIAFLFINQPFLLPSPIEVIKTFFLLFSKQELWISLSKSLLSLIGGFGFGFLFGLLLSIPSALSKPFRSFISPIFTVIRSTPVASFIIILWVFMDNSILPLIISLLMTLPIVWEALTEGFSSLDKSLFEVSKVFGFGNLKLIKIFVIPSMLPFLLTAVSTSVGLAWKSAIAAEILVRSENTIGFRIWDAKAWNVDTTSLFAWTLLVIFMSLLFDFLINILFRKRQRIISHELH